MKLPYLLKILFKVKGRFEARRRKISRRAHIELYIKLKFSFWIVQCRRFDITNVTLDHFKFQY